MCGLLIEEAMNFSNRLKNIEKRLEALEKSVYNNSLKKNRDDRWEEFVRIMKVQERQQKIDLQ